METLKAQTWLKFRHVTALVTLYKTDLGYAAYITFPMTYMFPGYNHLKLHDIIAGSEQAALQTAVVDYKRIYSPLDIPLREIKKFNFFLHRKTFRTTVIKTVGKVTASFVIRKHVYAISENIDGQKWFKCKFSTREDTTTRRTCFVINFENVLDPIHKLGFNFKFMDRMIHKVDKVKANQLRLFRDPVLMDDIEKSPSKLNNHISEVREDFQIALWLEKIERNTK